MQNDIPLERYPGANSFLRAYSAADPSALQFYAYNPHDPGSLAARLAELDARSPVDRIAAAAEALRQQRMWGADALAQAAAQSLGEPGVYSVVAGQQVGLCGGPLYTQLKALNLVAAARELMRRFPGRRIVPVFWMGTADSDFDEVRRTWVLDREGQPRELALNAGPESDDGKVVAARDVRSELDTLLAALDDVLPGGEHREEVAAALREAYSPQAAAEYGAAPGMAEGFARWMARLFAGTGLVLLDPQQAPLARLGLPLVERELRTAADGEIALLARTAEVAAAGYGTQVEHLPGDTHLFLLDAQGRRRKLARDGDGFIARQTGERYSIEALLELAAAAPERIVHGVMLRPVYQDLLFPPVAFFGGGAELAYRAQASAVFAHHGAQMAPAYFRYSATLLPAKSATLLDELGLELADCYCPPQDIDARAVAGLKPQELEQALARYRDALLGADAELAVLGATLDPTLPETFTTLRGNLERHAEKLEKKLTSALKHQHEALVRRAGLVHRQAYPLQAPQERVLNALSFLPRYGLGLFRELAESAPPFGFAHHAVILG